MDYQGVDEVQSSRKLKRQRGQQYSPIFSDLFEDEEEGGFEYPMELEEEKESEVEQQEEERELELEERFEQDDERQQIQEQESTSEEENNQEDNPICLTLADAEVLNCVICFELLTVPVYQCKNGHPTCYSCYFKLQKNNCPICLVPLQNSRCYAIERILEALKVPCPNKKYGCKETVSYSKINEDDEHEYLCIYEPCSCPDPGCNFLASSKDLSHHYRREHKNSGIGFIFGYYQRVLLNLLDEFLVFQEKNDGVLLILNIEDIEIGKAVNISSIGPKSSMQRFMYEVRAEFSGSSVKFRSLTHSMTGLVADEEVFSDFLLIPSGFFGHNGTLELEICINKA